MKRSNVFWLTALISGILLASLAIAEQADNFSSPLHQTAWEKGDKVEICYIKDGVRYCISAEVVAYELGSPIDLWT